MSYREKIDIFAYLGTTTFLEFPSVFVGKVNIKRFRRCGPRGQGGGSLIVALKLLLPPQQAFNLGFLGEACVLITWSDLTVKFCFGEVQGLPPPMEWGRREMVVIGWRSLRSPRSPVPPLTQPALYKPCGLVDGILWERICAVSASGFIHGGQGVLGFQGEGLLGPR